jgi:hypothetical protein
MLFILTTLRLKSFNPVKPCPFYKELLHAFSSDNTLTSKLVFFLNEEKYFLLTKDTRCRHAAYLKARSSKLACFKLLTLAAITAQLIAQFLQLQA